MSQAPPELTFQQAVDEIARAVFRALAGGAADLGVVDSYSDCVYAKSNDGAITAVNAAFRRVFVGGGSPVGRQTRVVLDRSLYETARLTDELILSGSDHLECEHSGAAADGRYYLMRTYKCGMQRLKRPGYSILGITRPLRMLDEEHVAPRVQLARLAALFRELGDRDREICRRIALGESSVQIGEQIGMTGRNVDLRRKKVFETLGVSKPVDLTRELIRLQERGYLDLGL